jgi:hypothetical protein
LHYKQSCTSLSIPKSISCFLTYLHHIQGHLRRKGTRSVEMLLRGIHVGPDKDLVVLARLELLVDEPFVVETVAQDEGVGDGPLQELGCDVGQV